MSLPLASLEVLAIDCQASGATPAHGDLLELAYARVVPGQAVEVQGGYVTPRSERPVPRAIREITGWSEARLAESHDEQTAFAAFADTVRTLTAPEGLARAPTVIHVARFELPFLRDLYARLANEELPLDVVCLHAVAARLMPDLPRKNIRALAGHLGHSLALTRCAPGHVEATAFLWRALVPRLAERGVLTWDALHAFCAEKSARPSAKRRTFPLAPERRRALPDAPGVYRFVRSNGDVLYVGKATSLRTRVASHFRATGPRTERALELLSQVHDIVATPTASALEAALLECDEIKALDPPYNVQLRIEQRRAWFASRDLAETASAADARFRVGPFPSPGAVIALSALARLASGEACSGRLMAQALAVPISALPERAMFDEGIAAFLAAFAPRGEPMRALCAASLALYLERGRKDAEESEGELAPGHWDLARVRRRLERNLVQAGLLLRRAPLLCLLADADVAFREPDAERARVLCLAGAAVSSCRDVASVAGLGEVAKRRPASLALRLRAFDAAAYDRLRVLVTELARVVTQGGEVVIRVGGHVLAHERVAMLLRAR